jgi:sodium-dependent phosphate cotransporter
VYMCTAGSTGVEVVGYIVAAIVVVVLVAAVFWYQKKGGRAMWHAFLEKKRLEREAHDAREAGSHAQSNLPHNAV